MKSFMKAVKAALVAVPLVLGSIGAQADVVDTSGGTLTFSWSYDTGGGVTITGTGSILTSLSGGNLVLNTTLTNTTALPAGTNMALMSFGFGIDPNASSVTFNDANDGMIDSATLDSIPSLATIEVCAYGGNNCNGGPVGDGIQAGGGSDSFILTLAPLVGGSWGSTVTIAPIGFKFQGTLGSFEFYTSSSSSSGSGSGETSGDAPEPSSTALGLLGLALLGAGFGARRRKGA